MSSSETNQWPGPFDSLVAFETFQDQSIARVVDFALDGPRYISDPYQLKEQMWNLGKILPTMILGLGRYNPDTTELHISENNDKAEMRKIAENSYMRVGGEPTVLHGSSAYHRMVNAWHNVDNLPHSHRFEVGATFESTYKLEAAYVGGNCIFTGTQAKTENGPYLLESISIPDTSRMTAEDEESHSTPGGATGALYSETDAPIAFTASPFGKTKNPSPSGFGVLTEGNIIPIAGRSAYEILQTGGETGLYYHLVRTALRKLIAGVDLGPVKLH